jgi:hypothetical protein
VIIVIICICLLCRKVCRGEKNPAEEGENDRENIKLTTKNIEVIEEIDEEQQQQPDRILTVT